MILRSWIGPIRSRTCSGIGSAGPAAPRWISPPAAIRSRCSPPAPTPCLAQPTWCWPPSMSLSTPSRPTPPTRLAPIPAGPVARRLPRRRWPPTGRLLPQSRTSKGKRIRTKPACSWEPTPPTRSMASRCRSLLPTMCSPATARGRSWPCPRTTPATTSLLPCLACPSCRCSTGT